MDLQLTYNQIDEYFSKYIESGNEKDESKMKMLKLICDVINSDFKYKKYFDNCTFDYLPVLNAINDSIKYYRSNDDSHPFHNYLFSNIRKAVNKYIEEIELQYKNNLNYSNRQLLKKIKKLLPLYQDNKHKVAKVLDISVQTVDELLYDQVYSLDKPAEDDSDITIGDLYPSDLQNADKKLESKEDLTAFLEKLDSVWKDMKPLHQGVISDWLTAVSLSVFEQTPTAEFMQQKEETCLFLYRFKYVNHIIVEKFFDEENYQLPLTFDNIGLLHGITKSAVCKKMENFIDALLVYPEIVYWLKQAIKYSEKKNKKNVEKIKILET